jgi:hypothetical protein
MAIHMLIGGAALLWLLGFLGLGMGRRFVAAPAETRELVLLVYSGLRIVDQSLDLAFDLFFFTAWILLAGAMFRHASFGRLLSTSGQSLASGCSWSTFSCSEQR